MNDKQFQIEFERRVDLISPDLISQAKPTSDTIFSFINQAQDRFVKYQYLADDQLEDFSKAEKKNLDAIKSLRTEVALTQSGTDNLGNRQYALPSNYFLYSDSFTQVTGTYQQLTTSKWIANDLIKPEYARKYLTTTQNTPIVPYPAVILGDDKLTLIVDSYTTPSKFMLEYYRYPARLNTLGDNHVCELPETVHSEIVDMAVEMFINENKYALQAKPTQSQQNNNQQ
jgi:hypothetical protein